MAEPLTGEMLVILGFIATYRFISSSPSKIASPRPAHRLWFTLYRPIVYINIHTIDSLECSNKHNIQIWFGRERLKKSISVPLMLTSTLNKVYVGGELSGAILHVITVSLTDWTTQSCWPLSVTTTAHASLLKPVNIFYVTRTVPHCYANSAVPV